MYEVPLRNMGPQLPSGLLQDYLRFASTCRWDYKDSWDRGEGIAYEHVHSTVIFSQKFSDPPRTSNTCNTYRAGLAGAISHLREARCAIGLRPLPGSSFLRLLFCLRPYVLPLLGCPVRRSQGFIQIFQNEKVEARVSRYLIRFTIFQDIDCLAKYLGK